MTTKNPNKSPKNKLTPIKDISKSQLLINWEKNPTFNLNIRPLHNCKDKIFIFNDNSNNKIIHNQRNIKTKDYELNMTINDILDKLEKHRNKNLDWENYYKSLPFNSSALALYEWSPIAEELKVLDRKIVLNSMILKWDNIQKEFKELISF